MNLSSKNSNVKQVKTKNKLTNAHDAAQFDGAYTLSILRSTFYLCTEISGDFAEVSEHEASVRTTRDTRYTSDTLESVCAMSCIRNNVWQIVVTRLTVSQMTNRKVNLLFSRAQIVKIHTSNEVHKI